MSLQPKIIHLKKSGLQLCCYGQLPGDKKLPLLFLHGASGNGLLWKQQLIDLTANLCPLAVDLPGHGSSGGKPASEIAHNRDYIKELAESLKLPPFVLAGHSMGGAIALAYALQYPQDLKAIILLSTGARLRVAPQILEAYRQGKQNVEQQIGYLYGPEAEATLIEEGKKLLLSVSPQLSFTNFLACNKFDVLEQLHRITLPALILCGEQDLLTPPRYSQFLAQKIKGSKLKIFPGCGHMLPQEKSKAVNKTIADFTATLQGKPGVGK